MILFLINILFFIKLFIKLFIVLKCEKESNEFLLLNLNGFIFLFFNNVIMFLLYWVVIWCVVCVCGGIGLLF